MQTGQPDFGVVERAWEARLRAKGLSPSRKGTGISTGHEGFEIYRQETQAAEFDIDGPPGHGFVGSVEVKVLLRPPGLGEFEVRDLVTQRGPSLEGALEACAHTFMDVTFPPVETLFTGRRPEGPGTGTVTLTSFTIELDRALKWDVILGPLQVLNDPDGAAGGRFAGGGQPPLTLMLDALTGHLSQPRLHWCKLYGANTPAGGLVFGCAIDGVKSAEAEAEMARKFRESQFGEPPAGEWEFRQFLVVRPAGDADPETTAQLRARAAETFGTRKRGWWARLFGR